MDDENEKMELQLVFMGMLYGNYFDFVTPFSCVGYIIAEDLWHCDGVCEALIVYQYFVDVVVLSVCIVGERDDGEDNPRREGCKTALSESGQHTVDNTGQNQ